MTIAAWIGRALAIAIAILAVIDPAVTSARRVPRVVSIVESGTGDESRRLADRAARELAGRFVVARGLTSDAAAVVATGAGLPPQAADITAPVFVVWPSRTGAIVRIEGIDAPDRVPLEASVPIRAIVHTTGAEGRQLEIVLFSNGVPIDRLTRLVPSADDRRTETLTFVPAREGLAALRVVARLAGAASSAAADAAADTAVSVDRRPWRVLVFDARPSWMSTFVRRALEDDPRFSIVSRTITSSAASAATPGAPRRLREPEALTAFDAVIAGAPDALSADNVAALEAYLRQRGGGVLALMDSPAGATPFDRLAAVDGWTAQLAASPVELKGAGAAAASLIVSETRLPSRLPDGAASILASAPDRPPIVWETPAGSGRLIVSGALDAWRHRAARTAAFDTFWRDTVARLAAGTPALVDIQLDRRIASPGDRLRARVQLTFRGDAGSARQSAAVSATIAGPDGTVSVRLWPAGLPGALETVLPAFRTPGSYRLTVSDGTETRGMDWLVAADRRSVTPDERALAQDLATSRAGILVDADDLETLAAAIDRAVPPERRDVRWHPMRHPAWIAPFALCLGLEWWVRRRGGRA